MTQLYVKKLMRIRDNKPQYEFIEYEKAMDMWAQYMDQILRSKLSFIDYNIKGNLLYKDFQSWVETEVLE